MKKITPYQSTQNALASLDNGGRFYNIATKANDGHVTTPELAKAAGVFSDKQSMMLFLEMSLHELEDNAKRSVLSTLSEDLRAMYVEYAPQLLLPSQAKERGKLAASAIITGVPKQVDSRTEFTGFIMVPITTGNVTTFTMIPIIDQYDIYEIRDNATSKEFVIAHAKSKNKLPEQAIRAGGVFKELKADKDEKESSNIFLETIYYSIV